VRFVLETCLDSTDREFLLGDLEENWASQRVWRAWWLWRQMVALILTHGRGSRRLRDLARRLNDHVSARVSRIPKELSMSLAIVDVRHAVRAVAGRPALTLSLIATLGGGIALAFVATVYGVGSANLVFLPIATLPQDAFLSWGWRIPFLFSAVLIVVGYLLRRTIEESPAFQEMKDAGRVDRTPLLTVLRSYPMRTLLLAGTTLCGGVTFYVIAVFGLSYTTTTLGLSRSTILLIVLVTMVIDCAMIVGFGILSDRIGRPKVFAGGIVGMLVLAFPWLWLVGSANPWLIFLAYVLIAIPHAANQGVAGVYFAEVFRAEVRYSGLSLGYTIGMIAGSAIAPMVAASLTAVAGVSALGLYMTAMGILSLVSATVLNRSVRGQRDNAIESTVAPSLTT
jgi:MFS family permease